MVSGALDAAAEPPPLGLPLVVVPLDGDVDVPVGALVLVAFELVAFELVAGALGLLVPPHPANTPARTTADVTTHADMRPRFLPSISLPIPTPFAHDRPSVPEPAPKRGELCPRRCPELQPPRASYFELVCVARHGHGSARLADAKAGEPHDMTSTSSPSLALVTGASTGIGRELAKQFAGHGFDLFLTAHDDLVPAASECQALGVAVESLTVDLASPDGVDLLWTHLRDGGRPLAAAALNAGRGAGGRFVGDTRLEDELEIVDLNVRSTVHLAKHVLADMVARGEGRVLFTSSIAATMPGTYQAVYNASKSFVQSFALALREELKDTGVTITSLQPGPTETEFFERAEMLDTKVGAAEKDDPEDVARDGFEALMAGKERVVSHSLSTKLQGHGSRILPDNVKAKLHAAMAAPGSAKDK